jgi:hypothetical protein
MKRSLFLALAMVLCFAVPSISADYVETVTFAWDQPDRTLLEDWEMHWGDVAGGPYVKLTTLAYQGQDQENFEGPITATVTGAPASTVTKFFVLIACGTVEGNRECSDWSNEVSYGFKIPFDGFQVPVNFKVVPTQ